MSQAKDINNWQECLAMSHAAEDFPFWEEAYRRAFPGIVAMINHRQDGWHQRAGIDRSIILSNSKHVLIDEKVRGRNKKTGVVYSDIALEFISNDIKNTPGWVCKPLQCDYIAYAIAPFGKCYLLPVLQLQSAWLKNKEKWLAVYGKRPAQNNGYTTWFCPVPPQALYPEIGKEFRVSFTPFEFEEQ